MAAAKAILYRILGNDLPPRYSPGQTLSNLRFILQHEPDLQGLEKRWLLNRIVDPKLQELQVAIEQAGYRCDVIPFRAEEYRQAWTNLGATPPECHLWSPEFQRLSPLERARIRESIGRAKNLNLLNKNGARNRALELGFADGADWVLPWDGGCFLPGWTWEEMAEAMRRPELHYLCVPMHRLQDHSCLPVADHREQFPVVEPQLAFAHQAAIWFDHSLRYGSEPKWQVLQRIGLPGPWQESTGWLPWEELDTSTAPDAGAWADVGLVLRLSGQAQDGRYVDEETLWSLRFASILRFMRIVDCQLLQEFLDPPRLRYWTQFYEGLGNAAAARLAQEATAFVAALTEEQALVGASYQLRDVFERICWLGLDVLLNGDAASRQRVLALVKHSCLDPETAIRFEVQPLEFVSELESLLPFVDVLTIFKSLDTFTISLYSGIQEWCSKILKWLTSGGLCFVHKFEVHALAIRHHLATMTLSAYLAGAANYRQAAERRPASIANKTTIASGYGV